MNILPKKRWHVRTKENIARVRRDEAKAAEEERQKQLRVEKAEREARTELLRKRARNQYIQEQPQVDKPKVRESDHVNLFYELEQDYVTDKSNPEHEKEKKLEREKYEKQIGYLTYLGQDTNEITGNVSWYNRDPKERNVIEEEVSKQSKLLEDPLRDIRKYLGVKDEKIVDDRRKEPDKTVAVKEEKDTYEYKFLKKHLKDKKKSKKSKKHKSKERKKIKRSSDSDSSDSGQVPEKKRTSNLDAMRAERIRREAVERKRAELVLKRLRGETVKEETESEVQQRYNSQFNPHLAKQNVMK